MNNCKLFFLLSLATLLVSCSGGDGETDPSTSCTKEVSFKEDGTEVTMPVGGLANGAKAVMQLKNPSPFDAQGVSRAFALRLQSGLNIFDIVLELNVADENSCIPVGVYDASTLPGSEGLLSFLYAKGLDSHIVALGEGSGSLEITKCDLENKLVSGRFSATMVQGFGSGVIVITDGVFEDVCFVE